MIIVRQIEPWMLSTIKFPSYDTEIKSHIESLLDRDDAPLFGAIDNDRLIGIGGVRKFGYVFGEWGLWLTEEIKKHPYWLVRTCKRLIQETCKNLDIRTMVALVSSDNNKNKKFIHLLGFQNRYQDTVSVDGQDFYLYYKEVA